MTIKCARCGDSFDWPDGEPLPPGFNDLCDDCQLDLSLATDWERHSETF